MALVLIIFRFYHTTMLKKLRLFYSIFNQNRLNVFMGQQPDHIILNSIKTFFGL
jgi:hypothetical protein